MNNTRIMKPRMAIIDGCVTTTSLAVAEMFGKSHLHVLRDIREITATNSGLSEEFGQSNFGLSSYTTKQNKQQPMYRLSKDGFVILAMGFTGPNAMRFKEAYINAFNAMEQAILKRAPIADKPLGQWDVNDADFFLTIFKALGREAGMAGLLVQLIKMGALGQWINASVRDVVKASDIRLSKSNVQYNTKRLLNLGLIDRSWCRFFVFEKVLQSRIAQVLQDTSKLLPSDLATVERDQSTGRLH